MIHLEVSLIEREPRRFFHKEPGDTVRSNDASRQSIPESNPPKPASGTGLNPGAVLISGKEPGIIVGSGEGSGCLLDLSHCLFRKGRARAIRRAAVSGCERLCTKTNPPAKPA